MRRSAQDKAGNTGGACITLARAATPESHRQALVAALLAGLALLATMLLSGCGQSSPTAAQSAPPAPAAQPAAAAEPVKAPPPAEPVKAPPPAIAPERLAAARALLTTNGCIGCHTIAAFPEAVGVIGPDLTHVNTAAAETLASQPYKDSKGEAGTPREFLRESILKPSAYVAEKCPSGPCPDFVMPRDFKSRLSSEELETILDMLVTFE